MHTIANFSRTIRIVFIIAALGVAGTRFSQLAAPEMTASDSRVVDVTLVAVPAHAEEVAPESASISDDMPHVVITARRMTPQEKAIFDAQQNMYASMQLGLVLLP